MPICIVFSRFLEFLGFQRKMKEGQRSIFDNIDFLVFRKTPQRPVPAILEVFLLFPQKPFLRNPLLFFPSPSSSYYYFLLLFLFFLFVFFFCLFSFLPSPTFVFYLSFLFTIPFQTILVFPFRVFLCFFLYFFFCLLLYCFLVFLSESFPQTSLFSNPTCFPFCCFVLLLFFLLLVAVFEKPLFGPSQELQQNCFF